MFYKPEVREKLRLRRSRLDAVSINQAALAVAAQIVQLKEFLDSRYLAFYLPIEGELDPLPIMHCTETLHKQLYLPVLPKTKGPLHFFSHQMNAPMRMNRFGINEPDIEKQIPIFPEKLDVIFLPLVGFDIRGNRIGRGAGYYDLTLAFTKNENLLKKPYLIGLAYEFQKIEHITPDKWDVPMNLVVTEKNLYYSGA